MRIVKKYKNNNGKTKGYDFSDGKSTVFLSAEAASLMLESGSLVIENGLYNKETKEIYADTELVTLSDSSANESNYSLPDVTSSALETSKNSNDDIKFYGKGFIKVCRKIRLFARQGNFSVDMSEHKVNGGRNTHLFKLMECSGMTVWQVVKSYLENIHPYSLIPFSEEPKGHVWMCDLGYKTSMLIKIKDLDSDAPIVVSFHESNVKGTDRHSDVNFEDKPCAIFYDIKNSVGDKYAILYTIQKGLIQYGAESIVCYADNDIALVDYADIKKVVYSNFVARIDALSSTYLQEDQESRVILRDRKEVVKSDRLSFMAYGYRAENNVILLSDIYGVLSNDTAIKRLTVDLALRIITSLDEGRRNELIAAVKYRFENSRSRNKLIDAIINFNGEE